jgi:hypothetical protein
MYSFGMTMLVSALPASQTLSRRGDWGGDVMIESIKNAFFGDSLFKDVIMNLLTKQGGDRSKADQAYEILFPNEEGTALVPEPEPEPEPELVKCDFAGGDGVPDCESLVSPDTLKEHDGMLICEYCYAREHEYDDY